MDASTREPRLVMSAGFSGSSDSDSDSDANTDSGVSAIYRDAATPPASASRASSLPTRAAGEGASTPGLTTGVGLRRRRRHRLNASVELPRYTWPVAEEAPAPGRGCGWSAADMVLLVQLVGDVVILLVCVFEMPAWAAVLLLVLLRACERSSPETLMHLWGRLCQSVRAV